MASLASCAPCCRACWPSTSSAQFCTFSLSKDVSVEPWKPCTSRQSETALETSEFELCNEPRRHASGSISAERCPEEVSTFRSPVRLRTAAACRMLATSMLTIDSIAGQKQSSGILPSCEQPPPTLTCFATYYSSVTCTLPSCAVRSCRVYTCTEVVPTPWRGHCMALPPQPRRVKAQRQVL